MKKTIALAALCLFSAWGLMAQGQTAESVALLAVMQPSNETPPISDTSVGNALIIVHAVFDSAGNPISGSVDFNIQTRFSGAVTVTGLHIHNAAAGVAGAIVIPTDVNGTDNTISIDATGRALIQKQVQFPSTSPAVALSTVVDMVRNPQNYYVNIHTTVSPGGAMRGQLLHVDDNRGTTLLMGLMSPKNENPPTPDGPSGVASVLLFRGEDPAGNFVAATAIFNLDYTGFASGTTFTGFHIHNGGPTVNGPVIINSGIGGGAASVAADPSGAGNLYYMIPMSPLDASWTTELATVNSLFVTPQNHYINIHSTVFGGGVMRDQMRNVESADPFQVTMSPANETPPIAGLTANAITELPYGILRNADGSVAAGVVIFDVNYRGFPAGTTFTGLHIHEAAAGTAGSIVIPTDVNANANKVVTATGNGNVFKIVNISSAAGIAALNRLAQNPNNFYANIHTTVNPGGAARGQLTGVLPKPAITGIGNNASNITTISPGAVISVYGSGLSPLQSDLSGFPAITALATGMNGVSVTIGGVKAPLYAAFPGQINAQVPFEVAAGPQPVIVTTAAGVSNTMTATVAAAAPSIFYVGDNALGAVVKNADFSLVTGQNRVKAGDVIVIYMTGLGQTTPAVKTGELVVPPSSGFNNTQAVTVTMGPQNAPIVYSIASPGFAGLYQVAVTVPSGVSGNVALVVSVGQTRSNPASVAVQ